nr:retron Ec78 anti-phage system effector HNH endonuclease PtuB [Moritella viscosa]SHO18085.1 Putative uncharacterized protein [Moritella viscosa]
MKKLARPIAGPPCLKQFRHGRDNWSVISRNNLTDEIWNYLGQMQNGFCAYCECLLAENNNKRHIEHFFQKGKNPAVTFDWTNLFGSCNHQNRCGKHKDLNEEAKTVDLNDVFKPDISNFSDYALFLTSGEVRARSGLNNAQARIADNTIKVFNLNGDSTLVNSRNSKIQNELPLINEYWALLSNDDNDDELKDLLDAELQDALERISSCEYSTALQHSWMFNQGY